MRQKNHIYMHFERDYRGSNKDHSLHTLHIYHTVTPKFVQLNNSKKKKTTGLEKFNEFANVHF